MKVTVKLYASLGEFLPPGAVNHAAVVDAEEGATVEAFLRALGVPGEMTHLVLVNGVYVAPAQRASRCLCDGDVLACWPPVAGG
jgi:sulfur carrier protein ThiS